MGGNRAMDARSAIWTRGMAETHAPAWPTPMRQRDRQPRARSAWGRASVRHCPWVIDAHRGRRVYGHRRLLERSALNPGATHRRGNMTSEGRWNLGLDQMGPRLGK